MSEILFMIVRFSLVLVLCRLLALPQAWRNGLVGDSIPALITELCLLLIQLELALLLIAAELITLINLVYGYFEFNTQTQFILSVFELLLFLDARLYKYLLADETETFKFKEYWGYFDRSDRIWLAIYVSSLFVPFIFANLTGLPPYHTVLNHYTLLLFIQKLYLPNCFLEKRSSIYCGRFC